MSAAASSPSSGTSRTSPSSSTAGPAPGGVASTVVECTGGPPRILRAGAIPPDALAAVLDEAGLAHHLRA